MSETPPTWQSTIYALIFHSSEPSILLSLEQDGWVLPHFSCAGRLRFGNVIPIVDQIRQTLNLDIPVLRWTHVSYTHTDNHQVDIICTLENKDSTWIPPAHMRWIERKTLMGLPLLLPQQREVIDACLYEHETHIVPALRVPWEKSGWFSSATSWMQTQLAQLGFTMIAPVEQVRVWGISCILRVPTTTGTVYFKASPIPTTNDNRRFPLLFANEAALTKELAILYPKHIPTPLVIDATQGWMLLEEFGQFLSEHPVLELWEDVLRTFSHIQLASAPHTETLLAIGCVDRCLNQLPGQIDLLLSNTEAFSSLEPIEVEQLQAYAPRFKAMCQQLAGYHIPTTLVHGDLHPANIALSRGKPIFFDWTDGCVSHPFFDAITFWAEVNMLKGVPEADARSRLRDTYLQQWIVYEPMERLLEAFALATPLGMLHQVISYQRITANMETPWKTGLGGGMAFWVRELLKAMAEYNEP